MNMFKKDLNDKQSSTLKSNQIYLNIGSLDNKFSLKSPDFN